MHSRSLLSGLAAVLSLAVVASAQTTSVEVTLDQFGVGSAMRPGDLVGMRLTLTSRLDAPQTVWVHWEKPNADGDIAEYGRTLTLTPNQPTRVWLYGPLTEDDSTNSVWSIKVFEENDGVRGVEIGGALISPANAQTQPIDIGTGLIAVIGNARLGLDDYSASVGTRGRPVAAHEETRIISGIRPEDLPDRWYGLAPYEAVAWTAESDPGDVIFEQAEAVREYVARGGHLIVVLPIVGNPWGLGTEGQTFFDDLMPRGQPDRQENVPLDEVLPILSKSRTTAASFDLDGLNVFGVVGRDETPEDRRYDPLDNNYYDPLVALPDGRLVVIRRSYGFGHITICGLDVGNGRLASLGLPQADVFWNRILGRRMDTPSQTELNQIADENRLGRSSSNVNNLGGGNLFVQLIQHEQSASVGVLLAFALFVIYWLVAGPGGFYTLRQYKMARHSWLAFAATAGLFTAVAWGAVAAVRPKSITFKHVTVLDHIARVEGAESHNPDRGEGDRQLQRAIIYGSAFLPNYRETRLGLGSAGGAHDVMLSWDPPNVAVSKFTNVDHYAVDVARGMAAYALPSRSTTTRLYANWLGGVDRDDWGDLLREDPLDPITVTIDATDTERSIRGSIVNNLPAELTNVTVFWVKNQRIRPRRYSFSGEEENPWVSPNDSGQMLNIGNTWRVPGTFRPGEHIPLQVAPGTILSESITEAYNNQFRASPFSGMSPGATRSISQDDRRRYLEMLSLFQQLTPPEYLVTPGTQSDQQSPAFFRELGRELDLSVWFTRPCVIVVGWLQNSEVPVSIEADGDPVESEGLTMIRWIFPLPIEERIAFKNVQEES